MKKQLLLGSLMLTAILPLAQATVVDTFRSGTLNTAIPDGNPTGITFSHTTTTGDANVINGVDVHLQFSGGFNGDLYGYLVFQATDNSITTTALLLNRVGRTGAADFGYSTAGMNVILSAGAGLAGNIHDAAIPTASTFGTRSTYYAADTRTELPQGVFSGSTPSGSGLDAFSSYSHNANGTWTLFLTDLSGGEVSTLVSWGLDVSVVPEPATWALLIFGAVAGGVVGARRLRRATAAAAI
jgi:hypothetical protein